jgi:hypothetical protein
MSFLYLTASYYVHFDNGAHNSALFNSCSANETVSSPLHLCKWSEQPRCNPSVICEEKLHQLIECIKPPCKYNNYQFLQIINITIHYAYTVTIVIMSCIHVLLQLTKRLMYHSHVTKQWTSIRTHCDVLHYLVNYIIINFRRKFILLYLSCFSL